MPKQEFLQLAHTYVPGKQNIAGVYVSEKLDGQRAFWDGGISRGILASEVPWSNTAKDKHAFKSTGLWSRYGKVIHAPDWWLDSLPEMLLDGELYAGREKFQHVESVCRNQSGTSDWHGIQYMVFDSPPWLTVFGDRDIYHPPIWNGKIRGGVDWAGPRITFRTMGVVSGFQSRYEYLQHVWYTKTVEVKGDPNVCKLHQQALLPFDSLKAQKELNEILDIFVSNGGEGVILKSRSNIWQPVRAKDMLKWKPFHDLEATVVGYTTGRVTDKGSRLQGRMGALMCKIPAGEFKVSGFTDEERVLHPVEGMGGPEDAAEWAYEHDDAVVPDWINNPRFPRGTVVTIKYRETTDAGLPKEARYWRDFNG
jgi:DNA ligase-1